MAEERNVGLQRAPENSTDPDATKAELQRRMEEARESISQTVTEIKETVVNQYQQVKESINDTLDWREQYRRRPLPFTVGAFGVGLCLGYSVMGAFSGGDDDEYDEELDAAETDASFGRIERGFDRMAAGTTHAYAASPVLGQATPPRAASLRGPARSGGPAEEEMDVGPETRPSYSSGYQAATATHAEQEAASEGPKGPGLIERFKETKAYDRLQAELSTLGERAVEELSRTAQTVVVPALLSKLKDLIGIDLSTQREVAQRSRLEHQTAHSTAATAAATEGKPGSAPGASGTPSASAAGAAGGGGQGGL